MLFQKIRHLGTNKDTLILDGKDHKGYMWEVVQDDGNRTGMEDTLQDMGILSKGEGLVEVDGTFEVSSSDVTIYGDAVMHIESSAIDREFVFFKV